MAADPNYDPTEFQDVLRAWMDRNGLSQMAAANTIQMSQGVLNRWLKPKDDPYLVQPDVRSLERLEPHIRVPLIELKRMTGRLSPADLGLVEALGRGPRNHRLEAFLADLRAQWQVLQQEERPDVLQQAEDSARVAFRLHHNRGRKPRQKKGTEDDSASSLRRLLILDETVPIFAPAI